MISSLFGSDIKLIVLLCLTGMETTYPRDIASRFSLNVFGVQNQLKNLEEDGIVESEMLGTLRMYRLNPNHPVHAELKALFVKVIELMPKNKRLQFLKAGKEIKA